MRHPSRPEPSRAWRGSCLLAALALGCGPTAGSDAGGSDAAPADSGRLDSGPFDAGPDSGPFDAGPDAGPFDAGPFDAGRDSGPFDAGDPRCAIPAGAHASVGAAMPPPGFVCERLPMGLASPRDVLVARDGTLYVSEFGAGRIVRLEGESFVSVVEGLRGPIGLRELDDGDLVVGEEFADSIARIDPATGDRTVIAGGLNNVTYIAHGPGDGAIYVSSFAQVAATGTGIVWRVPLAGPATQFVTGLHVPEGLLFDASGALVVVDWHLPTRVARFETPADDATVTTDLTEAYGLAQDGAGGLLVGDHAGRILQVHDDGSSETWLSDIGKPGGITRAADGTVWIAEFVDFSQTGYVIAVRPR